MPNCSSRNTASAVSMIVAIGSRESRGKKESSRRMILPEFRQLEARTLASDKRCIDKESV
jgi:hypothetical protein